MCTSNFNLVIPTGTYVTNRPFLTLTIRHTTIPGLACIFLVMTFWHYTILFHQPSLPAFCGIKGSCSTWLPRICLCKPNNPWIQHRILIQPSMKSQSLKITVFLLILFLFRWHMQYLLQGLFCFLRVCFECLGSIIHRYRHESQSIIPKEKNIDGES